MLQSSTSESKTIGANKGVLLEGVCLDLLIFAPSFSWALTGIAAYFLFDDQRVLVLLVFATSYDDIDLVTGSDDEEDGDEGSCVFPPDYPDIGRLAFKEVDEHDRFNEFLNAFLGAEGSFQVPYNGSPEARAKVAPFLPHWANVQDFELLEAAMRTADRAYLRRSAPSNAVTLTTLQLPAAVGTVGTAAVVEVDTSPPSLPVEDKDMLEARLDPDVEDDNEMAVEEAPPQAPQTGDSLLAALVAAEPPQGSPRRRESDATLLSIIVSLVRIVAWKRTNQLDPDGV